MDPVPVSINLPRENERARKEPAPFKADGSLEEQILQNRDYQQIGSDEISKLLGFFTQQQQFRGFPWHPYQPKESDVPRKRISDMEAFQRLTEGKAIELHPMRVVKMDVSAAQLGGVAALGGPISAAATNIAANLANANLGSKTLNRETANGTPILIAKPSYLKLLYRLHSLDQPENPQDVLDKATRDLSYFTAESKFSSYPWTFHAPTRNLWKAIQSAAKGFLKHSAWFGLVGVIAGAILGGPVGAIFGSGIRGILDAILAGTLAGAVGGGIHGAVRPLRSQHGEPYDEITVLDRLFKQEPVFFQKVRVQSIDLPLLGSFSWHSDYGKASRISNLLELSIFSKMQSNVQEERAAKA